MAGVTALHGRRAAFRTMQVPGGKFMSVAITNAGGWGWISGSAGLSLQRRRSADRQALACHTGFSGRAGRQGGGAGRLSGFLHRCLPDQPLISRARRM